MHERTKRAAVVYVTACVTCWSLIPIVSIFGQQQLDNHQLLFWSSILSFLAFLVSCAATGALNEFKSISAPGYLKLVILGLLGTYLYYLLLYLGYSRSNGMEVLVLQYTWPILIVIFSVPILHERMSLLKGISVISGFIGVLLVLTKGDLSEVHFSDIRVIGLVLLGSASFALFSVLSKTVSCHPLAANTVYFLTASIASGISMLIFSEFSFPTPEEALPVLINGLLVNGFSYLFWIQALKGADAAFIAPFTFLTPVLSAILLVLFVKEPFHPVYVTGLLFVLASGMINVLSSRER